MMYISYGAGAESWTGKNERTPPVGGVIGFARESLFCLRISFKLSLKFMKASFSGEDSLSSPSKDRFGESLE